MRLPDRPWVVIALLSLVLSALTDASFARAQQPKTKTATLLVDTDDVCHFFIDDEDKGQLSPDKSQKFTVGLGEHILKCKNDTIPDLVWRKVVEVKDTSQVAAVVALKALHIQYDQAVTKAQNQKAEVDAAAAKQLAEAQAEEKQRQEGIANIPQKMFEALKGEWIGQFSDAQGFGWTRRLVFVSLEGDTVTAQFADSGASGEERYRLLPPNQLQKTQIRYLKFGKYTKHVTGIKDTEWHDCTRPQEKDTLTIINGNTLAARMPSSIPITGGYTR